MTPRYCQPCIAGIKVGWRPNPASPAAIDHIRHDRFPAIEVHYSDARIRPNKPRPGVYLIGNYYVGSSANVRTRIRAHILSAITTFHVNKRLQAYILEQISAGKPIQVELLSDNPDDEAHFIQERQVTGLFNVSTRGRVQRS